MCRRINICLLGKIILLDINIFTTILCIKYINLFGPFMKVRERRVRGLMNPLHSSPFNATAFRSRKCDFQPYH